MTEPRDARHRVDDRLLVSANLMRLSVAPATTFDPSKSAASNLAARHANEATPGADP